MSLALLLSLSLSLSQNTDSSLCCSIQTHMLLPILWSTKVEILEVIHITCVLYYKSSESPKNLNISLFLFLSLSLSHVL